MDDVFYVCNDFCRLPAALPARVCMGPRLVLKRHTRHGISNLNSTRSGHDMYADQQSLMELLSRYDQQHLLRFWDELDDLQRTALAEQIRRIDFPALHAEFQRGGTETDWGALARRATSPAAVRLGNSGDLNAQQAVAAGEAALRAGQVAVLVVAGGQGSRLGFEHPKGMFPIGPLSQRTLFQCHADRIAAVAHRYQTRLPWLIMTSPATHDETLAYFREHDFLGLPAQDLTFFCQGTMPALDAATGKVLMESMDRVCLSPDGHGGTLAALRRHGCLDRLQSEGVAYMFYFQVDNPLVEIAAPAFLGYHIRAGSELTSQVVAKRDPLEKVGNVVSIDGRLHVIEYSDLPETAARQTESDGSLAIWAGSIAVHVFNIDFLQRMASDAESLPFHRALKAVAHIDPQGHPVQPVQPNALKLEKFIFDLLPRAQNALVVEVEEAEAFAPLKNATGAAKDTPESCRAALVSLHRQWLRAAGVDVADHVQVEINPRFALDEAELITKLPSHKRIVEDTYLTVAEPKE